MPGVALTQGRPLLVRLQIILRFPGPVNRADKLQITLKTDT